MTFSFSRMSAGVYEIQKNSETVGFIRKASASKWIVVDVVDTPQHVTKTLKEAKDAVVNLIKFDLPSQDVDYVSESEYNDSVEVEDKTVDTLEIQRQMLENNYVYNFDNDSEVFEVNTSDIPFSNPTLEPISF